MQKSIKTADVIATLAGKFVLIERQKFPFGLALPGGHVEQGESPKMSAIREFSEETGLVLREVTFITRRRGKHRDPRYGMSETNVYAGITAGTPKDEQGSTKVVLFSEEEILKLPKDRFAFDHYKILGYFFSL